jgi:MPBQ/MSBQ methyltransferase
LGVVERVDPANVTLIDQSPHQLAKARAKPGLKGVTILEGDAEALPFATDSFDRYVSAGSIEYWPDPQRGICEAYRCAKGKFLVDWRGVLRWGWGVFGGGVCTI